MPYIITSRASAEAPNERVAVRAKALARHAVATLDEARSYIAETLLSDHGPDPRDQARLDAAWNIPESGGTVCRTPEGTVIEVEYMSWLDVRGRAGVTTLPVEVEDRKRLIIDAFNAR